MGTASAHRAWHRVWLAAGALALAGALLSCAGTAPVEGDGGYACTSPTICPGEDTECVRRTCVDHACGVENVAAGTATAAQTVGDCMQNQCDGQGGVVAVVDDTDAPDDGNDCTRDSCNQGAPVHVAEPAGTPCGDGLVCAADGTCASCQRAADCPASTNECLVATCSGGACGADNVPDGTGCDDGSACTLVDTCQTGQCAGSAPVVCTPLDQCHDVGTCDPATGTCSDPAKADGTDCDDANACTQTDTCQAGVCTGGNPIVCTALDQCHNVGTCNATTGACSNPTKANGTQCNDGNACTQTDSCQSGACVGASPVVCTALDQCHDAGTCNPATGACDNPEKAFGTLCTGGYCSAGSCVPATHGTATFDYTGGAQQFTVPLGIVSVTLDVYGAQGNTNAAGGVTGGLGGRAQGTLSVTPGAVLTIYVGGGGTASTGGGYNGGGAAGSSPCATARAGGGGGASDVRVGGTALANRVIVAGGGGGAGGNRISGCGRGTGGGGGGGRYGGGGGAGWPSASTVVPTGGTQSAGGAGGTTTYNVAYNGGPGALGSGGAGGGEESSPQAGTNVAAAGGAGGGTTGSAGAYSGNYTGQSGAGGSGYVGGVTGGTMSNGARSGNGRVIVTY